jgi:Ser-tRNA(Ala) deacylase AlaX
MHPTLCLYLDDMAATSCEAHVLDVRANEDGSTSVVLDRTVCYPQGGGQPSDHATIDGPHGSLAVSAARRAPDGVVEHRGTMLSGTLVVGDAVACVVDAVRRLLNSRVHTAGHVIDAALQDIGARLLPAKGFHDPVGAYVAYAEVAVGQMLPDSAAIAAAANARVATDAASVLRREGAMRFVTFGDREVACGGTHVAHLTQVGTITIRAVKRKEGQVRISYAVS